MRIDKYLKISRLIKRRTVAKQACEQGRIHINDKIAKAGSEVDVGDVITLDFATASVRVEVLKIAEHVKKEEASDLYRQLQD